MAAISDSLKSKLAPFMAVWVPGLKMCSGFMAMRCVETMCIAWTNDWSRTFIRFKECKIGSYRGARKPKFFLVS